MIITRTGRNGHFWIVVPQPMLRPLVQWYHDLTVHATGADTPSNTLGRHFYHPDLLKEVKRLASSCQVCKPAKKPALQYGKLSSCSAPSQPWSQVYVEFHGTGNKKFCFYAFIAIDPVTNLLELTRHPHIKPRHARTAADSWTCLHNCWLCRYSCPSICLHDNGSKFTGNNFQLPLAHAGIQAKNITPHNSRGNSIIEQVHLTVAMILRVLLTEQGACPSTAEEADTLVDRALAIAQHAVRVSSSTALNKYSPGELAFGRDMLLHIPVIVDFCAL